MVQGLEPCIRFAVHLLWNCRFQSVDQGLLRIQRAARHGNHVLCILVSY
jgi:hypothetical protein